MNHILMCVRRLSILSGTDATSKLFIAMFSFYPRAMMESGQCKVWQTPWDFLPFPIMTEDGHCKVWQIELPSGGFDFLIFLIELPVAMDR